MELFSLPVIYLAVPMSSRMAERTERIENYRVLVGFALATTGALELGSGATFN